MLMHVCVFVCTCVCVCVRVCVIYTGPFSSVWDRAVELFYQVEIVKSQLTAKCATQNDTELTFEKFSD